MDRGSAENFEHLGTIGIEEEYFIVDANGRPVSGTDELVYEHDPPAILEDRLDHELFKFVIETQTPVIESIDEAGHVLNDVRTALVEHAQRHGFEIAAAGLHPTAKWRELEHAEKPRYRAQLDRIQYPQHRNTTAGLHIHIGIDDAEKAMWIANEIRWYLPLILAVSANSPFWCGYETGLQSARAKIFEALPNTGMPTAFDSFEEYLAFERTMVDLNAIRDRGELWFDVRPHSELGTVEIRTPDSQANEDRVIALVEYVYHLVMKLASYYDDGVIRSTTRRELLDENKWRAMRWGRQAELIRPDSSGTIPIAEIVEQEAERLGVDGIRSLYYAESGADRLRRLYEQEGSDAVCRSLMLNP